MLGYSYGEETEFACEYGIPEKGIASLTTPSNEYQGQVDRKIFGCCLGFGGKGSGMNVTYRHLKANTSDLFGTGADLNYTLNGIGADYRYRWWLILNHQKSTG